MTVERVIPKCGCEWCRYRREEEKERQPEHLLGCSGPFLESADVHDLALYVLELERSLYQCRQEMRPVDEAEYDEATALGMLDDAKRVCEQAWERETTASFPQPGIYRVINEVRQALKLEVLEAPMDE